jgi:tripartite-type tricarboxylate transporter receptor subunit TctC
MAQKLSDRLGQQVVVDNRTGAGGAIGAAEVAKADPTATRCCSSRRRSRPSPRRRSTRLRPGHAVRAGRADRVGAARLRRRPVGAGRHDARVHRARAPRARQAQLRSAGSGSVNHLALELFMARTGTTVVHVPYRGIADATKDLLGGTLQAMTASIPAALPLAADKRVRVLAVTGPKRIPQMPDVPSWQEQGVANAEVINYWGIVAPAGTPREPIARIAAEVKRILAQPDVRERLEREGAELIPASPPSSAR